MDTNTTKTNTTQREVGSHKKTPSERKEEKVHKELNPSQIHELEEVINVESPDGRPAHAAFKSKEMLILAGGSILAVLAISGVTYALFGSNEAFMVLILGIAFAVGGNPVIWAMFFRGKERETIRHKTIEQEYENEPDNEQNEPRKH